MSSTNSYYFTLFKKFQVIDHVPFQTPASHGDAGAPAGGFDLTNPQAPFVAISPGTPLTLGDYTPANNPLWAMLNSRAQGNAGYSTVGIPGGAQAVSQNTSPWLTMPPTNTPGWVEFQINPASNKLVDVFANWIATDHQVNDVPTAVLGKVPAAFNGPDPGVSLFVCSMPNDQGVRPGVPADYWATSLIYLVDPSNGNTVNPPTLTAGSEYYLAAIIGNRGNTNAGRYLNQPAAVQAAASVMVWNTFDSPGVQLPALSNLDITDKNGIYEQYFLRPGHYDTVGFRMNVQTVFNGIIHALKDAVANDGLDLGGLSPEQWVLTQPAHLCAKVVVRVQGANFPAFGATPDQDARIAQKNLAPFDINITTTDPNPNINWKNFIVGQPLFFKLPNGGKNKLTLQGKVPRDAFQLYLAMPPKTFERLVKERKDAIKGFKEVPAKELADSRLGRKAVPFPEAVVLRAGPDENSLEFGPMTEGHFAGMSLGIEYLTTKLKHGPIGEITLVQESDVARLDRSGCYKIERAIVGGFTLIVRAEDGHMGPKGKRIVFED